MRRYNAAVVFSVLIVDDEIEICISLGRILRSKGYSSRFQTNPLAVLEDLRNEKTDLIIMDIKMPEMSGLDLLEILKKNRRMCPSLSSRGTRRSVTPYVR